MITADDQMTRPIDSLLRGTAMLVRRIGRLGELDLEDPLVQHLLEKEEQMRVAYMVALRLRAGEVVVFAARVGLRCSEAQVRNNPFLVATAIDHWVNEKGKQFERGGQ